VAILRSLPGIGRINLATLLSEASGPLSRRDYQALRTLSGVAPVTKRSGKSHVVVMRYASHVRLRNTVYHWARVATQHDQQSRAGAVAICVGICLAQSPVERGYWIRQRGQSARRRACVARSAIRRLCAW
jgi:transposase